MIEGCCTVGIYAQGQVLYCIVLYCVVLCCVVLCCIVLYCIVLYCIVLYCIVLYCIVLYLYSYQNITVSDNVVKITGSGQSGGICGIQFYGVRDGSLNKNVWSSTLFSAAIRT